ncbi:hypothetical protein Fmac_010637 [Flemingia macrophylla]|uniref:Uncharacterized protein n=1 Tax=Flemingia macrophylla TaxID=520843 RepID=A0ABD1MK59_9FABA
MTTDNPTPLEFMLEFHRHRAGPPPDVEKAFSAFTGGASSMSADHLLRFLSEHQGEERLFTLRSPPPVPSIPFHFHGHGLTRLLTLLRRHRRQPPPRLLLRRPSSSMVKLMCSYGGRIQPRPHDNHLTHIAGDTKILSVDRHVKFPTLLAKLSALANAPSLLKYQLPPR